MPKRPSEPTASELLKQGLWTPEQVALLLDTPLCIVLRWCAVGLMPGAREKRGEWAIPGRSLFLFCNRRIEPHYSPETVAALLDKSVETVRGWLKESEDGQPRIKRVKLGVAKSASVLIPESELRRWLKP